MSIEICRHCDKRIPQCSCADGPTTTGTLYDIACPYCGEQFEELWDGWDDDKAVNSIVECGHCERESRIYHLDTVVELSLQRLDDETTSQLEELRTGLRTTSDQPEGPK